MFRGVVALVLMLGSAEVWAEKEGECPPGMVKNSVQKEDPAFREPSVERLRRRRPEAPPQLATKSHIQPFGCQRAFLYRGKTYPIDSYHRQDAERLRPVIKRVPRAVSELNEYQSNRRSAFTATYLGTFGLIIALGGFVAASQIQDDRTSVVVRNIGAFSGLGLMAGSFIYRFSVLSANEGHLEGAVNHYNRARPKDRVKLQFSTGIVF